MASSIGSGAALDSQKIKRAPAAAAISPGNCTQGTHPRGRPVVSQHSSRIQSTAQLRARLLRILHERRWIDANENVHIYKCM
jgi:hypothetical protein